VEREVTGLGDCSDRKSGAGKVGMTIYCPPKLKPPVGAATSHQLASIHGGESLPSDWKAY
jgi:hypothetical protein